ncbi:unnamed protein product, partial [Xylocopa violacea]
MSTKGIVITLLCVTYASVHCARNSRETSELLRKCCFDSIDRSVKDYEPLCTFRISNHTLTMISYNPHSNVSDMSCCTACFENTFETKVAPKQRTGRIEEYLSANVTMDVRRFCFNECVRRIQSIKVSRQRDYYEGDSVNISRTETDKFRRINEEEVHSRQPRVPQQQWHCNSVFTSLNFWGANIVIFANIIYIIPYLIVVLVYAVVPGLGTRAYNKSVICYNVSQIILNGIVIGIGACALCHVPIHSNVYIFTGLTIMFLTISSTFWLFVICIDMTLAITRFRCTLPAGSNRQKEKKKFLTYAAWTWGGSFLPTALACVAELSPLLPQLSPFRPNFSKFQDDANLAVILYVMTFPAMACLANTILFCYTSYKMILIQKATTVATASNNHLRINMVKKRYFLFLKLYLLMDAPWITSALAAIFTDLWVLKFLRMIQPILMLSAILPARSTTRIFSRTTLIRK